MNTIQSRKDRRGFQCIAVGLLLIALLVTPAGAGQAQPERPDGPQPVDAQTARHALLSGRVLPVDASRVPEGATSQTFYPLPADGPVVQAGAIAYETDRHTNFDLYEQPADGSGSASALVTGLGQQVTPAWSPNGQQLAFVSDQDGDFEIYLRDQGGQVRKLTDNTADDAHPAWSPAGDRIFFASDRAGSYFQIYSMRPDGSDVRPVGSIANNHAMAPSVSPNGSRIAFMRASVLEPLCQWNWDVWVMNIDGSNPQRITNHLAADLYPTWTPDGSEVVLAGCRNFLDFDLYAVNAATGNQRRLTNWLLTNEWGARYAGDGAHLAFNSDRDGNNEIYTMPATGGTAANLTRHPADDLAPSWRGQTGGITYRIAGRVLDFRGHGLAGVTVADNTGRTVVTDAAGNFALENLPAGVYTITPTKAGFTFGPDLLQVDVPPGSVSLEFRGYDRPPIVFVHGFQGNNPSLLCGQYDPDQTFEAIDNQLGAAGRYTITAKLTTSMLCGTPSLAANIPNLTRAIDQAKSETGQERVILVGHSMGGLVSRAYLESEDFRDRHYDVLNLFTFGTPHHGIPVDSFAIDFGPNAVVGLGAMCLLHPALCEFSYTGMMLFNLMHPDRADGVTYHLISGNASGDALNLFGGFTSFLLGGPNDAAVQTFSGTGDGLTGISERWVTNEVHGKKSGPKSYFYWADDSATLSDSYRQCLEPMLVNTRTLCQRNQPPLDTGQQSPLVQSPIQYGHLLPGATTSHQLTVEAGQVLFATQWITGTLLITLVNPTGMLVDPAYAASHPNVVTYETGDGWAAYTFPAAAAGQWQVRLQGTGVPSTGAAYATSALFESNLRLSGGTDQLWYRPGATAVLTASLSAVTQSATVTADVLLADGSSSTVNLAPIGGGRFQGNYVVQNVPGYAEVRFQAQGTMAGGGGFERSHSALVQISPSTANLSGSYGDTPVPRWSGAAVYAALDVTAGVNVAAAGDFSLSADLVDSAGNRVAHALTSDTLSTGARMLTLRFDGGDIYRSGHNGPYTLTNILLVDNAGAALIIQQAQAVYVTRPYAARDFRVGDAFLPVVLRR